MQQRFLLQMLLLAQHVSGITMPIIRSSRVLYSGCCVWYFVLWFFKQLVWCVAEGYASGLQDASIGELTPSMHKSALTYKEIIFSTFSNQSVICICICLISCTESETYAHFSLRDGGPVFLAPFCILKMCSKKSLTYEQSGI